MGCVYGLIAIGFTLLLGVVRYTNFAHGQLVMVAMFLYLTGVTTLGWPPFLVAIVVVVVCGLLSATLYGGVTRFAIHRQESTQVVVTLGLLLIFQSVTTLLYGPTARAVETSFSNSVYQIGDIRISQPITWAAGIAIVSVVVLVSFLERTDAGKAMRATAQNPAAAALVGINPRRVYFTAIVIAATLEGIAGAAVAPVSVISPFAGFTFILKAFVVVVIAGLGRVAGALYVGVGLGVVESLANLYIGSELATATIFGLLIVALLIRPQGLFTRVSREYV
jgi:branched-chain amino acid transport system permease protein